MVEPTRMKILFYWPTEAIYALATRLTFLKIRLKDSGLAASMDNVKKCMYYNADVLYYWRELQFNLHGNMHTYGKSIPVLIY